MPKSTSRLTGDSSTLPDTQRATSSTQGLRRGARAIVVVEGVSDQVALETLAKRLGRDLAGERVDVVPIGGAHAIARFLESLRGELQNVKLAGMCDRREEPDFRRALERAGFGGDITRAEMENLGFFVCDADLEDELIRALGPAGVERVIDACGELKSFRSLQKQPAQRERTIEAQLRRFMGTHSGRKAVYARELVNALALEQVPHPLRGILEYV